MPERRDLSGKKCDSATAKRQVLSGGLDVHDFAMAKCPEFHGHSAILPFKTAAVS